MRRRLLQAAIAVVLVASTLGTRIGPAVPDPPVPMPTSPVITISPPPIYYVGPDEAIVTALTAALEAADAFNAELARYAADLAENAHQAALAALWPTDAMLARLRQCESTDRYAVNTGNGFYGAYQFDPADLE